MQFGRGKPSAGAFFDSDFTSLDTLLAMAVLYGLQGKNDCRMAIITTPRPDLATVGFIDMVERFYHGPGRNFAQVPPIGMRTEGKPGETPKAFLTAFGTRYTNQVKSVIDTGDPNTMFRNYLEAQYDQNAFFVLAGPATNLAAALDFRGMKELITSKIKYLVVAGSEFPGGTADARRVFAEWPTPIVLAPSGLATELEFPGASIDKEFKAAEPNNPVADAYRAWRPDLSNTRVVAAAAALYAGRPKEGYFKLSDPGVVSIGEDGRTSFTTSSGGKHRQLSLDPEQKEKVVQAMVELASAKPVIRLRFRPDAMDDKKADENKADDKKVEPDKQ